MIVVCPIGHTNNDSSVYASIVSDVVSSCSSEWLSSGAEEKKTYYWTTIFAVALPFFAITTLNGLFAVVCLNI